MSKEPEPVDHSPKILEGALEAFGSDVSAIVNAIEDGTISDADLEAVASAVHIQTRYAMSKLLERLVVEGYVVPARAPELLDRAQNMERGLGFLTKAELARSQSTEDFLA